MAVLWIFIGLIGIALASDVALRGAESIAQRLGIPPLIVGLTLTSIGTSMPEIATNITAGLSSRAGADASGLMVGNIVGSCLSQITLLLGLTGLAAPLARPAGFRRDGAMMIAAALLMLAVSANGTVQPLEGGFLIAVYVVYVTALIVLTVRNPTPTPAAEADTPEKRSPLLADLARVFLGLGVVIWSADLVVHHSVSLAREAGISEGLIGLGLGLGTGMPELAVALQSVRRRSADIGLGNLIGSNITDPLLSFGAGAVLYTVTVPAEALWFDFPAWLLFSAIALVFIWSKDELARWESAVLLSAFLGFFVLRLVVLGT